MVLSPGMKGNRECLFIISKHHHWTTNPVIRNSDFEIADSYTCMSDSEHFRGKSKEVKFDVKSRLSTHQVLKLALTKTNEFSYGV